MLIVEIYSVGRAEQLVGDAECVVGVGMMVGGFVVVEYEVGISLIITMMLGNAEDGLVVVMGHHKAHYHHYECK